VFAENQATGLGACLGKNDILIYVTGYGRGSGDEAQIVPVLEYGMCS
jgi:hypothetical protein